MSDTLEALLKMRAVLGDPEHWIKGDFAKTAKGWTSFPGRPDAAKFCLMGACAHFGVPATVLRRALPGGFGGQSINFNDHPDTTHADIVAVLDRAIELEQTS